MGHPASGNAFAPQEGMSKQNPNQIYYKTGGRSQSEGPDRLHENQNDDKARPALEQPQKNADHPALRRAKKK